MRTLLAVRGGGIGDLVATFPALRLARQAFPGVRIILAGRRAHAPLAAVLGVVDGWRAADAADWAALHGSGELGPGLAEWLAGFDACHLVRPEGAETLAARLRRHLAPGARVVEVAAQPAPGGPAWLHYAAPLATWGVDPGAAVRLPPLQLPPSGHAPAWGLHPGSGSRSKNWPADHWRRLARGLAARGGLPVRIFGGEAEAGQEASWRRMESEGVVELAWNLPLTEAVERLAACTAFAGHDSGFSHLAAALGLPSLVLFGPTDPVVWTPWGPRVQVLRPAGSWEELEPEQVLETFLRFSSGHAPGLR